ncbi:MAG: hypothetical protein QOI35_3872 [Cryptosporangiaceae bacterium]|nr:hypothetical protein [Cryptosporangiaceae bacterium]
MRLTILEHLYRQPGPYTSVYLDTSRDSELAQRKVALRWREAATALADQGAPEADITAIRDLVEVLRPEGPSGHAIFAADGVVRLAAELEGPPRREIHRYAPLPHAMPLIAQHRETIPHVLVVTDRVGADVTAVGYDGDALRREIEGRTWPIRKVQAGGWSHRRYQQAAEETWERNAAAVARATTEAAHAIGAKVVLVAGEERARSELLHALGPDLQAEVIEVPGGGRAAGIDQEAFQAEVAKLLADRAAAEVSAVEDRFREELGQHDKAAAGFEGTVRALQLAQAEVVLVNNDDPAANGTLFAGPEPGELGLTRDELRGEAVEDRADAVLVRAAAATDAQVTMVPPEELTLPDGLAALLRYRL